jgi:hypothetical protein
MYYYVAWLRDRGRSTDGGCVFFFFFFFFPACLYYARNGHHLCRRRKRRPRQIKRRYERVCTGNTYVYAVAREREANDKSRGERLHTKSDPYNILRYRYKTRANDH